MVTRRKKPTNLKEYQVLLWVLIGVVGLLFFIKWAEHNYSYIITFGAGLLVGILFILWLIRKLVSKVLHSKLAWAVFSGIVGYKVAQKFLGKNDKKDEPEGITKDALKKLGFKDKEISEALTNIDKDGTPETQVKQALNYLDKE